MNNRHKSLVQAGLLLGLAAGCLFAGQAFAGAETVSDIATRVMLSFEDLGKLIIATAYVAGIGFGVASIFKFKQHKDNPTQIPLGTPMALLGIAIALLFLPLIFGTVGTTIFGETAGKGAGGFTGLGVEVIPGAKE